MPSAKILSEKQAYVADLKAKFESAVSGCVVAYGGINVENDTKLRKELREAGVDYMVVKNTMLRLAVKGTALEGLAENFKGDTAVAFAHEDDPMAAARILCKYQDGDKSKKFVVKAGFMEGKAHGRRRDQRYRKAAQPRRHAVHVRRRPHQHSVWSGRCNAGLCRQAGGARCLMAA